MKRAVWVGLCVLLIPGSAVAQTAADHALLQCGTIADASARLTCYDAARDQSKAAHWPEFNAAPTQQAAPARQGTMRALPAPNDKRLVAGVVRYDLSPRSRFTVVLDNGEIWRQLDSDDGLAQFNQRGKNVVQISKGFWGSYDLRLNTTNIVFKVTRIR